MNYQRFILHRVLFYISHLIFYALTIKYIDFVMNDVQTRMLKFILGAFILAVIVCYLDFLAISFDLKWLFYRNNHRRMHEMLIKSRLDSTEHDLTNHFDLYHCKVCQKTVANGDHHCYILGTCIGRHNHWSFMILLHAFRLGCVVFLLHTIGHKIVDTRYDFVLDEPYKLIVMIGPQMIVCWMLALLTIVVTHTMILHQSRLINLGLKQRLETKLEWFSNPPMPGVLLDYLTDSSRINVFSIMNRYIALANMQNHPSHHINMKTDLDRFDELTWTIFDESEPDVEEMVQMWTVWIQEAKTRFVNKSTKT